ncbi:MAG: glycosyltransferase 87 family protein, partial [Candidatus Dormibacteria bacterium]
MLLTAVIPAGLSLGVSLAILVAMLTVPEAVRGADFHVFYAAGWAVRHGLDPYRAGALAHASILSASTTSGQPLGAFPYLPWVGWAMAPWSLLPYPASLVLWQVLSGTLVLASARVWARSLGWHRAWTLGVLASVSTVAFLGYQVGQLDAVALALIVGTVTAAGRGRWLVAGLASAAVVLLKPQLALPLVPLLWVVVVRERAPLRSVLTGQAVALAVLVGLPMCLQPGRMRAWMLLVMDFSHSIGKGPFTAVGLSGAIHVAPSSWHLSTGLTSPTTIGLVAGGLAAMVFVVRAPMPGR